MCYASTLLKNTGCHGKENDYLWTIYYNPTYREGRINYWSWTISDRIPYILKSKNAVNSLLIYSLVANLSQHDIKGILQYKGYCTVSYDIKSYKRGSTLYIGVGPPLYGRMKLEYGRRHELKVISSCSAINTNRHCLQRVYNFRGKQKCCFA